MAKVTLVFKDEPDGKLNATLESDPPFPGPAAEDTELTFAQQAGWCALDAVINEMKKASVS